MEFTENRKLQNKSGKIDTKKKEILVE